MSASLFFGINEKWNMELLKRIECKCCGQIFEICRSCYKGQVYCSKECQKAGYLERHREAQKKYQRSKNGKKKRNEAAKRRRKGKSKYKGVLRKLIQSCICLMMIVKKPIKDKKEKCIVCGKEGKVVDAFPSIANENYEIEKSPQKHIKKE